MQLHNRGQCTGKSLIALAIWAASFLILGAGCGGPTPTPTPTPEPVVLEEAPSITLAPPGPTIKVQPGEELAITAKVEGGIEPQVTWTATCLRGSKCQVLKETAGKVNFFTAPRIPDEQVIVSATVKDKYDREDSATLTFKVVPKPTPTATPVQPTETPTPTPTPPTEISPPSPPLTTPPPIIELNPADFLIQADEFFLDVGGVDLTDYDLEFTFSGGDGRQVQLWYKDQKWFNVYSWPYTIQSDQPIRYNPFTTDGRNVDQFDDFTHINAIGAKVFGGVEGVKIKSARLIRR